MQTRNVFHLINRFGNREDQVSAAFGFILQTNQYVLTALLHRLGIHTDNRSKEQVRQIEVDTQVPYMGRDDPVEKICAFDYRANSSYSWSQNLAILVSASRSLVSMPAY